MKTIFELFRLLPGADSPTVSTAIDILECGTLPEKEARKLAEQAWRALIPPCEKGRILSKESFWAMGSSRFVWKGLCGINQQKHADWLILQIRLGSPFEKYHTRPAFFLPSVRDGKY